MAPVEYGIQNHTWKKTTQLSCPKRCLHCKGSTVAAIDLAFGDSFHTIWSLWYQPSKVMTTFSPLSLSHLLPRQKQMTLALTTTHYYSSYLDSACNDTNLPCLWIVRLVSAEHQRHQLAQVWGTSIGLACGRLPANGNEILSMCKYAWKIITVQEVLASNCGVAKMSSSRYGDTLLYKLLTKSVPHLCNVCSGLNYQVNDIYTYYNMVTTCNVLRDAHQVHFETSACINQRSEMK